MLHSTVKGWKLFSKIRNKTKVPTLTILIQHSTGSSSQSNLAKKRHDYWKRSSKIFCIGKCYTFIYAAAKSLQLCPTLCDPIDGSPPGSPVPGILQARILEWVAISFSNAWRWKVKVKSLSRVQLLVTPWTVAHQAPPSMGFSKQEYWNGVPLPSPTFIYRKS